MIVTCIEDIEKEKSAIKKINERLMKFNSRYRLRWIGGDETHVFSNIEICGECLGRRHWDNALQLVNAFDYSNTHYFDGRESVIDKMYNPFWGLTSQIINELLVKLDLNDV